MWKTIYKIVGKIFTNYPYLRIENKNKRDDEDGSSEKTDATYRKDES